MQLQPILSAMRRNKVGAVLIALQMAVTLAILCNALFIVQQRLAMSKRPTGMDERNVFVIENQWVGHPPDLKAKLLTDLAALRSLPGVVDAVGSETYPLRNGGWTEGIVLNPEQKTPTAQTALYFADEHGLNAMGLKLIAGRNFNADEVMIKNGFTDFTPPTGVIVTRALAQKLFPGGDAVGKIIYVMFQKHTVPIIGVVDRLQTPWTDAGSFANNFIDYSIIEPFDYLEQGTDYIVRAQPGQLDSVMKAAEKKLMQVDRARLFEHIRSQTESRQFAYKDDRGLAIILAAVCSALILVTAFGIVGLTSYWVAQRRRQIGIRRALGATRVAIVRYFQTENFLIAAAGAAAGIALAIGANLWMVSSLAMSRLDLTYAAVGAIVVLLLGQAAVLWPALKAASIPPALATRAGV